MFKVSDIMTTTVFTISRTATAAQAMALMQGEKLRALIVDRAVPEDDYGILTERDIAYHVIAPAIDPDTITVADIMRHPCIALSPDLSVQEAAQCFQDTGIQRAPVIQHNRLVGVLSISDMVMKPMAASQDQLSRQINEALRHARVISAEPDRVARECALAWDIREAAEAG